MHHSVPKLRAAIAVSVDALLVLVPRLWVIGSRLGFGNTSAMVLASGKVSPLGRTSLFRKPLFAKAKRSYAPRIRLVDGSSGFSGAASFARPSRKTLAYGRCRRPDYKRICRHGIFFQEAVWSDGGAPWSRYRGGLRRNSA